MTTCLLCTNLLPPEKRKYCSAKCKLRAKDKRMRTKPSRKLRTSIRSKRSRRKRGMPRKLELIKKLGGECKCGYNKNLAALVFHHKDPTTKLFELNSHNLSKMGLIAINNEIKKCELMCQNCHHEFHNPNLDIG